MKKLTRLVAAAALAAAAASSLAAPLVWVAAPDQKLEGMRGGFAGVQGLMVSFGIVRSVEIDGKLTSYTALTIPDLRSITSTQAQQLAQQAMQAGLVQTGRGNAAALPGSAATAIVIQNTQNDRQIRSLTEINAASNGMGLLKDLNLNQTLNDALGAAAAR